jgi:hypothetical protein
VRKNNRNALGGDMANRTNTIIIGPPGTGKSHNTITSILNDSVVSSTNNLVLSFTRNLRLEKMAKYSGLNEDQIHTFDSYMYEVLKRQGRINREDIDQHGFDILHNRFKSLDDTQKKLYDSLDQIIVDEYQVLSKKYINLLRVLVRLYECRLILIGDAYQNTQFKNIRYNFQRVDKDFPGFDFEIIVYNKCYRTDVENQRFINGFMPRAFPDIDPGYLYQIPPDEDANQSHLPQVRLYQDKQQEYYAVLKLLNEHPDKEILILGRHGYDLNPYIWELAGLKTIANKSIEGCEKVISARAFKRVYYSLNRNVWRAKTHVSWTDKIRVVNLLKTHCPELIEIPGNVKVSTIHSAVGTEADVVFFIGLNPLDYKNELNIIYEGITRHRDHLIITSAHPADKVVKYFEPGTYTLDNKQRPEFKLDDVPALILNAVYRIETFMKSTCDSLDLSIRLENLPYFPWLKSQDGKYGHPTPIRKEFVNGDLHFKIAYNFRHNTLSLYFHDLNVLKSNGLTDKEIMLKILLEIEKVFDYRLDPAHLIVKRLDQKELNVFKTQIEQQNMMTQMITDNTNAKTTSLHCYYDCMSNGEDTEKELRLNIEKDNPLCHPLLPEILWDHEKQIPVMIKRLNILIAGLNNARKKNKEKLQRLKDQRQFWLDYLPKKLCRVQRDMIDAVNGRVKSCYVNRESDSNKCTVTYIYDPTGKGNGKFVDIPNQVKVETRMFGRKIQQQSGLETVHTLQDMIDLFDRGNDLTGVRDRIVNGDIR